MLTRIAQPTNRPRPPRGAAAASRFSAAGGALAAVLAVLLTLCAPGGAQAAEAGGGDWPWPLLGEVVTPYRNGSDPYAAGQHRGLDIAAPAGTPVRAIVDGRVSYSGRLPDGGETVTVRSADGAWLVGNLHLSRRDVARGSAVSAGDVIGAVGTTGKRSVERPHLHLSVRRADDRGYVDPMSMLGVARLPEIAAKPAPPAAQQAEGVPASRAPRADVTPLEGRASHQTIVHAQTGDTLPAARQGAGARPTAAAAPAGISAREGHAARHTGRVAPPPLPVPVREARAAGPAVSAPAEAASAGARGGPPRALLIAIAAVCLVALLMRGRRREPLDAASPPREAGGAGETAGEVLEFTRVQRRA